MKQIIVLTLSVLLLGTSCQNEKAVSNKSSLEIYADSLFQESVDSSQIAGGAILVFQNGENC